MTEELLNHWIDVARWAPSGGNSQPWNVRILNLDQGRLIFYIDPLYRVKPSCMDYDGAATIISLGAFLESLAIVVEFENYVLKVQELGNTSSYFDFYIKIQISISDATDKKSQLISSPQTIRNRVTNRTQFLKKDVPADFQNFIYSQALQFNLQVVDLSRPKMSSELISTLIKMEKLRWDNVVFLSHLLNELIEDNCEKVNTGIPFHQLNLNLSEIGLIKALKKIPVIRRLLPLGISRFIAKKAVNKPLSPAPFFCYLVSDHKTPEAFFNLGRCVQRIWLKATEQNLGLQPLSNHFVIYQALLYPDRFHLNKSKLSAIESISRDFLSLHGINLSKPVFGFRLGYPSGQVKPSYRKSVDQILFYICTGLCYLF